MRKFNWEYALMVPMFNAIKILLHLNLQDYQRSAGYGLLERRVLSLFLLAGSKEASRDPGKLGFGIDQAVDGLKATNGGIQV